MKEGEPKPVREYVITSPLGAWWHLSTMAGSCGFGSASGVSVISRAEAADVLRRARKRSAVDGRRLFEVRRTVAEAPR